jgi:hypothetical protein
VCRDSTTAAEADGRADAERRPQTGGGRGMREQEAGGGVRERVCHLLPQTGHGQPVVAMGGSVSVSGAWAGCVGVGLP